MTVSRGKEAAGPRWLALLWRALAVWLVPFVGTGPLIGTDGRPIVSFAVFKAVAVLLLLGVLLVMRRWAPMGWRSSQAAVGYVVISVLLDLIVLVAVIGMSWSAWALTVLPAYLLVPVVLLVRVPRHATLDVGEPPPAAPLT